MGRGGDMSPAGGVRLSAYLIVKNESRDLPACLDSLRGLADELVVVDDESTDDTAALCRERGAHVFTRALDGFGTQKQYALDRCGGEWVLSIDADERVTPELAGRSGRSSAARAAPTGICFRERCTSSAAACASAAWAGTGS